MKVVIVEDEISAAENLIELLKIVAPDAEVVTTLDSVKKSVAYFQQDVPIDLVFMDIHLADGISFEIFDAVDLKIPVIFTTAYDQYALKAFKENILDYLLKPIDDTELKAAIDQYQQQANPKMEDGALEALRSLFTQAPKKFRTTFLVNQRDGMIPIKTEDIAFFYIEDSIVYATTKKNQKVAIDKKLEEIEEELDPQQFKRVNRQFIVNREALVNIKYYFNGKLIVNTQPPAKERMVVSKARATEFKTWVDN